MTTTRYHHERFAAMHGQPLSNLDLRVLQLVAVGATDAEIAQQLPLTLAAVKWVQREIRARLGARDRAHAVHLAHLAGHLGGVDQ